MGLDMYLRARRNVSDEATRRAIVEATADVERYEEEESHYLSRWSHTSEVERSRADKVIALAGLTSMVGEDSNSGYAAVDGSWADVTAVYWRKANAVHAWFVGHCQAGIDECQEAEVHVEQLAALASTCESALAAYAAGDIDKASLIMEPRPGFFFGSTEVDEYWAEDLQHTVREIHRIIRAAIATGGSITFAYQSSW